MMRRILIALFLLTVCGLHVDDCKSWQDTGSYSKFELYDERRDASEIRIILDNLANQLNMQPSFRAYLISYAGKKACGNEATLRLLEAKRYLKENHKIDSTRVTFLDGGFQPNWAIEIWIGFKQNTPPNKEPRLKKKQIIIVKNCTSIRL